MDSGDAGVLAHVYGVAASTGVVPRAAEVAEAVGSTEGAVREAFRRLDARRLFALAPDTGEVVMAPPFSAVPTAYEVFAGGRSYFANCSWDALGVPAALHKNARIRASCACCREPISLRVDGGAPIPERCVAHFAVPAAQWWDDIVYT